MTDLVRSSSGVIDLTPEYKRCLRNLETLKGD